MRQLSSATSMAHAGTPHARAWSLSLSLSLPPSLSLSLSLTLPPSLPPSLSLSLFLFLPPCLCLSPSLPPYLSLSLSQPGKVPLRRPDLSLSLLCPSAKGRGPRAPRAPRRRAPSRPSAPSGSPCDPSQCLSLPLPPPLSPPRLSPPLSLSLSRSFTHTSVRFLFRSLPLSNPPLLSLSLCCSLFLRFDFYLSLSLLPKLPLCFNLPPPRIKALKTSQTSQNHVFPESRP